jgi:hypothetical protein
VTHAEARQAVIALLMAGMATPETGDLPEDMQAALRDALAYSDRAVHEWPGHFGVLLGVTAALFRQLAIEAAPFFDVGEFLRRYALYPMAESDDDD